jgi:predicted DNA-binding protein (UPF0251 family)
MPRPACKKIVNEMPEWLYFKPVFNGLKKLDQEVLILPEEFYCLSLCLNYEKNMKEGANKMGISPATFCRLKKSGMKKILRALLNGEKIRIDKSCD